MNWCVGYSVSFPFIKHEAFSGLSEKDVGLYKYMFAPDLQRQTLAIIGCVEPLGPHPPLLEIQSRVAIKVFKVLCVPFVSFFECCSRRVIHHHRRKPPKDRPIFRQARFYAWAGERPPFSPQAPVFHMSWLLKIMIVHICFSRASFA